MKLKLLLLGVLPMLLVGTLPAAEPPPTPLLTKPEAELIRILNSSPGEKDIADACRELAVVGSKAAVPTLVPLLANERFSHYARHALETIPDASVDAALRSQLANAKGRIQVGVIASLGVRRDAQAVKPLADLLEDADPTVAQAAARALGSIATAEAAKALQAVLPWAEAANQAAICEGLFRSAETMLAAGKTQPALAVYESLAAMKYLPLQVHAGAVRGEIIARGPSTVALLKQSLLAPEYELFAVAIRSALELRQLDTTKALAETLPQLTGDRELVAIKALGELGDVNAVAALLPRTRTGSKATRGAAIQAAIATGHAAVVPVLVQLLSDADAQISSAAQDGLAALAHPSASAAVAALLTSSAAPQRIAGLELVGRRKMTSAIPALLKAAGDPEPAVRVAALKRLGELGGAAELEPVLQRLVKISESRELEIAGEAASAICVRVGNPKTSTGPVILALKNAAPAPRATLLGVLGAIGGADALLTVRLALSDANPEVHQAAVQALTEWPDASAIPMLAKVVSSATASSERELAFNGLIRITRDSELPDKEKLSALVDAGRMAKTSGDKRLVLAGLGDISSIESLRAIVPYLSETEVADDASASAVRIAGKLDKSFANEVTPVLLQVLKVAKSEPVLAKARAQIEKLIRDAAQKPS
jgi:HEAT repeat protein